MCQILEITSRCTQSEDLYRMGMDIYVCIYIYIYIYIYVRVCVCIYILKSHATLLTQ